MWSNISVLIFTKCAGTDKYEKFGTIRYIYYRAYLHYFIYDLLSITSTIKLRRDFNKVQDHSVKQVFILKDELKH